MGVIKGGPDGWEEVLKLAYSWAHKSIRAQARDVLGGGRNGPFRNTMGSCSFRVCFESGGAFVV